MTASRTTESFSVAMSRGSNGRAVAAATAGIEVVPAPVMEHLLKRMPIAWPRRADEGGAVARTHDLHVLQVPARAHGDRRRRVQRDLRDLARARRGRTGASAARPARDQGARRPVRKTPRMRSCS